MTNQIDTTVLPLVEDSLEMKTQKRNCKFHINCKNATDPEHAKNFTCMYLKPCRNGLTCEKINDENHKLYFTHSEDIVVSACKYGSKCKKTNDEKHNTEFTHVPKEKKEKKVKKEEKKKVKNDEVQHVTAKFVLDGTAIDGSVHNISTIFRKKLPKSLDANQIKEKMSENILKRYVKGINFSKLDFKLDVSVDMVTIHVEPQFPVPNA